MGLETSARREVLAAQNILHNKGRKKASPGESKKVTGDLRKQPQSVKGNRFAKS